MLIQLKNDSLHGDHLVIYGKAKEVLPHEIEFKEKIYSKYSNMVVPSEIAARGYKVGILLQCCDCTITGLEAASNFKMIVNHNKIFETCSDIWKNPEKYSNQKGEDVYSKFLKYLWVKYPDGTEKRLAEIVS